jgi:hypothetical protein
MKLDNYEDPLMGPLNEVIKNWGMKEFVLCVFLFPFSLFYIMFRYLQELIKE